MFAQPTTPSSQQQQTLAPVANSAAVNIPPSSAPPPISTTHFQRGIVKQVLSGDAIIVRGQPRGGPPPEKQINLSNITAPRLARRPTGADASVEIKDEPFAWDAREFLRKKLVGQEIFYTVQYTVPGTGREYGIVYLGKDTNGENVAESLVAEGLVEVRQGVKVGDEYYQRLTDLQNSAKSASKGKWSGDADVIRNHVRHITWSIESPRTFVDSFRREPVDAVIEHIRDGSTVRAFLLPSFNYVTIMITGIRCPGFKLGEDAKVQDKEDFAEEAKFFVESRLLQRDDVKIVLESASNQSIMGTILHPKGNIAEFLLSEGFAKCVDWSLAVLTEGTERYRAAERLARDKRLRLWKSYEPTQNGSLSGASRDHKTFQAKVVEIVMGDALVVKKGDNEYQKIWLSSIKPPRPEDSASGSGKENQVSGRQFRPLYDIPYMFEAREFLRKKLIDKKVTIAVDYVQPAFEKFPEKTCCTVSIGGQNVAEALVAKGLATVIRYAQNNENRSSQYDQLLSAEAKAEKSRKGLHSLKVSLESSGTTVSQTVQVPKEVPIVRVQDLQGDYAKSKQFYPFLQRAGRSEGVVEFVASGSRFRIYVPKETCLLTFLLSGISCPRASRSMPSGVSSDGEPFGDEALRFIKELCLQHEVEFEVETMDKAGNFVGYAFLDNKNLSELLVEKGLAKLHSTAERSKWYTALKAAEDQAKSAQLNIWTLPENKAELSSTSGTTGEAVDDDEEQTSYGAKAENSPPVQRTIDYKNVCITEVMEELRFYVQFVDQGPKLERIMSELRAELIADPPVVGSYTPRKGELCAAKFVDGQWYRARVENAKSRDHCDIFYIDYGNRETTDTSRLASLPSNYHSAPAGAKEYRLAFIQLPKDPSDVEMTDAYFRELLLSSGQQMLLNVEYKVNGFDHVTLSRPSDKMDIGKQLVAQGYALVENRRERRVQGLLAEYKEAQNTAKKSRLNLWQYGDFTGDEL